MKRKKAVDDDEEDEEEKPVRKASRKPTSKVKAKQGGDGDEGEDEKPVKKATRKPASKAKAKQVEDEGEDEDEKPVKKISRKPASKVEAVQGEDEEEDEDKKQIKKTSTKPASKDKAPSSKDKSKATVPAILKEDQAEDEELADATNGGDDDLSDELASINGIKPKVYLTVGEEKEIRSMTRCVFYFLCSGKELMAGGSVAIQRIKQRGLLIIIIGMCTYPVLLND